MALPQSESQYALGLVHTNNWSYRLIRFTPLVAVVLSASELSMDMRSVMLRVQHHSRVSTRSSRAFLGAGDRRLPISSAPT